MSPCQHDLDDYHCTGTGSQLGNDERAALAADRARIADIDVQISKLERASQSQQDVLQGQSAGDDRAPSALTTSSGKSTTDVSRAVSHTPPEISALLPLREERDLLRGRLDAYTYPVLTLPNEIVAEIFLHFLPVYPDCPPVLGPRSPIALSQICRKWRETALCTPLLWRAFEVNVDAESASDCDQILSLLGPWLERSGSCPLSIKIQVEYNVVKKTVALAFFKAILRHRARWEHLNLKTPSLRRHKARPPIGTLPLLRTLTMNSMSHFAEVIGTDAARYFRAPQLRRVSLKYSYGPFFNTDILPWAQLTVLTVFSLRPQQCAAVLNQAVNLVHCRVRIFYDDPPENLIFDSRFGCPHSSAGFVANNPISQTGITLRHLKTLTLSAIRTPSPGFLDVLTLPALRILRIAEPFIWPDPIPTLASFVSRSGCTLQQLSVTEATLSERGSFRNALPSIASFRFQRERDWALEGESDVDE
ncbi:hypothetical protein B0H11DRAFT_2069987 [Mycena galericulata]|nr:hypothetical protein B0H11DRAFT_2069987 [Mycena galericulata]